MPQAFGVPSSPLPPNSSPRNMKTDPILAEIRAGRDAHAKQFNYDLAAICADNRRFASELKKQGWKFVKPLRRRAVAKKLAA